MTLSAQNLCLTMSDRLLFENSDFSLQPASITSILGPNGAGKSSVMRVLAGMKKPSTGSVSYHDTPLLDLSVAALAQTRSYMAQQLQLTFPYSAQEVVRMALFANPHARAHAHIVQEVMEAVDVWDLRDRRVFSLSGGETQRVYLSHCLAQIWRQQGAWLLLDEPFSAQDLRYHHLLSRLFTQLVKEKGYGIVIVNHLLEISRQISDAFLVIENQQIQLQPTLTDQDIQRIYNVPK